MSEKVRQPPVICRSAASSSAISASISCRSRPILSLVPRAAASAGRFGDHVHDTTLRRPAAGRPRGWAPATIGRRPAALLRSDKDAAAVREGVAPERLHREVRAVQSTLADALWPDWIQAHLSAFSSPLRSSQPPFGYWSVIVSAISWPSTIVMPALPPRPLKFAPHDGAGVRDVRQIRVGDVAVGRRGRAVPRAVLRPEAGSVVVRTRSRPRTGRRRSSPTPCSRSAGPRLTASLARLRLARRGRCRRGAVEPGADVGPTRRDAGAGRGPGSVTEDRADSGRPGSTA